MEKRHERTLSDLKKLKEIKDQEFELYAKRLKIKKECPCLDRRPQMVETLAFEYTPRSVCPVCQKDIDDLTLEEKIACFKEHFKESSFSEEEYLEMAKDGGYNLPQSYWEK